MRMHSLSLLCGTPGQNLLAESVLKPREVNKSCQLNDALQICAFKHVFIVNLDSASGFNDAMLHLTKACLQ